MRNIRIAPDEHYHIFNRGVNKQNIFLNRSDYARFLFLILYFQSPITFQNICREVKYFVQHSVFNISEEDILEIFQKHSVEIVSFCLMPNHFHLIIKEEKEGGIAQYMQRVLNSYTKYFNTKYKKSGHLFQGPYKAVRIEDNRQLLHTSAYIHRNPRELREWYKKEHEYPWSSYQDFTEDNRWKNLLSTEIILGQFKNKKEYEDFLITSPAKMLKEEFSIYF